MAHKLTLKLTAEQQGQIKAATGKEITELSLDSGGNGEISDADLEGIAGGTENLSLSFGGGQKDHVQSVTQGEKS